MTDPSVLQDAETIVLDMHRRLTTPLSGECLCCFVVRMVDQHGCDTTLRWAQRFRDLRAPRATALEQRLGRMGGYCDCEIFLNGVVLAAHLLVVERDEDGDVVDSGWPRPLPPCTGVRRGSTQWCANWERRWRYGPW